MDLINEFAVPLQNGLLAILAVVLLIGIGALLRNTFEEKE
jgi:hypothetical protein